jgi:hypothetical protein
LLQQLAQPAHAEKIIILHEEEDIKLTGEKVKLLSVTAK